MVAARAVPRRPRGLGRPPSRASAAAIRIGEKRRRSRLELLPASHVVRRAHLDGAAEPDDDDLGGLCTRDGLCRVACGIRLEPREASQLRAQVSCLLRAERESRRDWLLECGCRARGPPRAVSRPVDDLDERAEQSRIDVALAEVRDQRRMLPRRRPRPSRPRSPRALPLEARPASSVGLVGECAPARVHLEQHRLGSLTGEPELTTRGVVAMPLCRDRGAVGRVEQLRGVDEPESIEQAKRRGISGNERRERLRSCDRWWGHRDRIPIDEHRQAAESLPPRLLEQREAVPRIAREHRRSAPGEGGGDRTFRTRLDLEGRERERLAGSGEGARRGRDPFALGECPLERLEPLAGRARALGDVVALGGGRTRRTRRDRWLAARARAATGPRASRSPVPRRDRLARLSTRGSGLVAETEALTRGTERHEAAVCALLPAGRVGEARLDPSTLGAQAGNGLPRRPPRAAARSAATREWARRARSAA